MRILLAEADSAIRTDIERRLQEWGYDTVSCVTGKDALETLMQPDPPKLAILAWRLPELDGLQVCRRLREKPERPYIYTILLAQAESKEEIFKGLEAGADEYLIKPFDINELQVRIRTGSRIISLQETFTALLRYSERQAAQDPLTGLWNQAAMRDILRREIQRATRQQGRFGLMIGGLDQLDRIKDEFGPLTSDAVLREVVLRIRSCIRVYDYVGRSQQDDFIILAPGCDEEAIRILAKRLRKSVNNYRLHIGESVIPLTMSFGVLVVQGGEKTVPEEIMQRAEDAMQRARMNGGDRILFE